VLIGALNTESSGVGTLPRSRFVVAFVISFSFGFCCERLAFCCKEINVGDCGRSGVTDAKVGVVGRRKSKPVSEDKERV